ncbi:hypothetical protein Cflav_PD5597 [Pedosphaera parvula Ellin514]|uniref:Uncharacterized protein n=2 Tax=Pedosphaera TaxID=1032526 RepID=B9XBS7_PEDPL|nr:hypothetical protein [Pedosphaera parvula]EEF62962.1 hypothetical protein Cflav_PD5597 [Pedosphaera parvula Ellin514]
MRAAFRGHPAVVWILLDAGAEPLARQAKQRGRKARSARELAEAKLAFVTNITLPDERDDDASIQRYNEVRRLLLGAEGGSIAT